MTDAVVASVAAQSVLAVYLQIVERVSIFPWNDLRRGNPQRRLDGVIGLLQAALIAGVAAGARSAMIAAAVLYTFWLLLQIRGWWLPTSWAGPKQASRSTTSSSVRHGSSCHEGDAIGLPLMATTSFCSCSSSLRWSRPRSPLLRFERRAARELWRTEALESAGRGRGGRPGNHSSFSVVYPGGWATTANGGLSSGCRVSGRVCTAFSSTAARADVA